jgi:histone arginine demethylase JMJD6
MMKIDRVNNISVDEFRKKYSAQNLPVVISGCVEHWPARKKWNLDYFAKQFPGKELLFSDKQWNLASFIEELRKDVRPTPYLNQVKLDEQFQELYEDVGDLQYTKGNLLNSPLLPKGMRILRGIKALFIGSAGSGFGKLHWDSTYLHVYISQLHGDKDFLLYSPSDTPHLYPNPENPNDSLIKDINNFDASAYPDLQKASPIRLTVHEGETIFIPAGWWHATKMNGVSISIAESALDKSNWQRRYKDYLIEYRHKKASFVKRAMLSLYMRIVGIVA